MKLRPNQAVLKHNVQSAWALGFRNVLAVAPCGFGKTVVFDSLLADETGASVAIAHRQELVSQMSLTLARYEIPHRVIAPMPIIRWVIQLHAQELGRDYYDPAARCAVAGVDTLLNRSVELARWLPQVRLWIMDEGHHLLRENKWGKAAAMFPNARGLGVSATPRRADGKGLGRHADGLYDQMVEGPSMRTLITGGYLSDYRVFCPPSNLDLHSVSQGVDGDYVRKQLAAATRKSTVLGDVVTHYLQIAPGKLGVTFAPDVETATDLAARFNAVGVTAEVVSAKTPDKQRVEVMRRFARRQVLQIVNVDLLGEGFDCPAMEVVSMARATQSYALYVQQFGRPCRIQEGKDRAIVIDHVGNVVRHGLPDSPQSWSLDRREKRSTGPAEGVIPLRVCLNPECMAPYERIYPACPFCGYAPVVQARSGHEWVDGDLYELDPDTLAAMRGEVLQVDRPDTEVLQQYSHMGSVIAYTQAKRHRERQEAQQTLRDAISWFGGHQRALGRDDRTGWRAFYHTFGVDVLTAQALGRAEAEQLTERVNKSIGR